MIVSCVTSAGLAAAAFKLPEVSKHTKQQAKQAASQLPRGENSAHVEKVDNENTHTASAVAAFFCKLDEKGLRAMRCAALVVAVSTATAPYPPSLP